MGNAAIKFAENFHERQDKALVGVEFWIQHLPDKLKTQAPIPLFVFDTNERRISHHIEHEFYKLL
jgi:hypothetical protein